MSGQQHKVSAVVIAYNDATYLRACLETLSWVDELVVVDSFSSDETAAVGREFTEKVFQHEFKGFGRLRNEAVAHATHDWVFSLDTDERTTPELIQEIRQLLQGEPASVAYYVPRRNFFLGKWIRYCGWYPDYRQPQLFRKSCMRYREEMVHEGVVVDGPIGYLREHVLQYPFRDIDHYLSKMDRYSDLMAKRMEEQHRSFHAHQLLTHPIFTFLKMYLLRRGMFDGMQGLILSGLYAYYTAIKYAKFWERTKDHAREKVPLS